MRFLSFNFSQEISINRDKVDFLVVIFNLAAVMGFLWESLDFNMVVFLEQLPHFLSGKDKILLLLKSVSENNVKVAEFTLKARQDVRIEVNYVLVGFGEGASAEKLQ